MNASAVADRKEQISTAEGREIMAQLERILSSHWFSSSHRSSTLLRHVVQESLLGHSDRLKERLIGIEAFQRNPSYDSNADPIVRVAASEVRKRLAQYYSDPENAKQIRIELSLGVYVPLFRVSEEKKGSEQAIEDETAFVTSGFEQFWAPVFSSPNSALISIGDSKAFQIGINPNAQRGRFDVPWRPGANDGNFANGVPFVHLDNALAACRIAGMLGLRNKSLEAKSGTETNYADLSARPVILIAAYDNDWTIRETDVMRFRFEVDLATKAEWIADREKPSEKIGPVIFGVSPPPDFSSYALVARSIEPSTGQPVIIVAGIVPSGTAVAAEFVSNSSYLNDFAKHAPKGWAHRNIEFLISASLVDGVLGRPQIVAYSIW